MFKERRIDTGFIFSRSKMGVTITCHEINKLYVLRCNGRMIHATSDDCRNDETASDAAFFTAWNIVTGFEPFSVIRNYNGRFKRVGLSFIPAGHKLDSLKYTRGGAHCRFSPIA